MKKILLPALIAIMTVLLFSSTIPADATMFFFQLFYTTSLSPTGVGIPVKLAEFTYDDATNTISGLAIFTVATQAQLAASVPGGGPLPAGADGVVPNPNRPLTFGPMMPNIAGQLFVGGQNTGIIYTVDRIRPGPGGASDSDLSGCLPQPPGCSFHLEAPTAGPTSPFFFALQIMGQMASVPIDTAVLGGTTGTGTPITIAGSETALTSIITTPSGSFYVNAPNTGLLATFGTVVFSGGPPPTLATTTQIFGPAVGSSGPAISAHGGTFDPFTTTIAGEPAGTILMCGNNIINQYGITTGTLISSLVLGAPGSIQLDNCVVDGLGHVLTADNGGTIFLVDYRNPTTNMARLIGDGANNMATMFMDPNVDDLAPLSEPIIVRTAGENIPIDTTMVLLGATEATASWMIPAIVAAIGIGLVVSRKV